MDGYIYDLHISGMDGECEGRWLANQLYRHELLFFLFFQTKEEAKPRDKVMEVIFKFIKYNLLIELI